MLTITELNLLPDQAGVYKFFDIDKNLLYIGKATSLKSRVKSYFSSSLKNRRTCRMASQIAFIDYIITIDATAARILENNLILLLRPQFNIQVREESKLAVIEITQHKFPQIKINTLDKTSGEIFGPFPTKKLAQDKIKIIQKIFQLRVCDEWEFKNRSSPCILYQFKQCSAPCVGKIDQARYMVNLNSAKQLLAGEYGKLLKQLKKDMLASAANYLYEEAGMYRDAHQQIIQFKKNKIIPANNKVQNFDLIIYEHAETQLFIYLIMVRNGIYSGDTHVILNNADATSAIINFFESRYTFNRGTREIYLGFNLNKGVKCKLASKLSLQIKYLLTANSKILTVLWDRAQNNLKQIIDNYNYTNLYMGSVNMLQQIFNLNNPFKVIYIEVSLEKVLILNEEIQSNTHQIIYRNSYKSQSSFIAKLKAELTYNMETILIIKLAQDIEKIVLQYLAKFKVSSNILLVKPIPHSRQAIVKLNKFYNYNIDGIVNYKSINKLVNLFQQNLGRHLELVKNLPVYCKNH